MAAAVRVMNAAPSRPSRTNRRLQGSQRKRSVDGRGDRVVHDFAAASIKNDCKTAEPDGNSDMGNVRHSDQIRLGRNVVAVEVREDRSVVIAVGGANEAAAPLDPQGMLGHDLRDALVVDSVVTSTQFVGQAAVSVARESVLNAVDQFDQVLVCHSQPVHRRAVVAGAPKKFDHFATPSGGAAFGPLMIEHFSLLLTRRRDKVFKEIELHREPTDLALECRDLGLVVVDPRRFDLFAGGLTAIELRELQINEIGRLAVLRLCLAPAERAALNLLTELELELRSVPLIRNS